MPSAAQSRRSERVSSAATRSAATRVARARAEASPRFPIGVATSHNPAANLPLSAAPLPSGPPPFERTTADMTNPRQAPLLLALAIAAALALGACESRLAGRSPEVQAPPPAKPETGTVVPPPPPEGTEATPETAPFVMQPAIGQQRL